MVGPRGRNKDWGVGGKTSARVPTLPAVVAHVQEEPPHVATYGEGPFVDIGFDDEAVTFGTIHVRLPPPSRRGSASSATPGPGAGAAV
jgi:hypothetical protein